MSRIRFLKKSVTYMILSALLVTGGLFTTVQAETYFGASVGASFGGGLDDNRATGIPGTPAVSLQMTDLDLDTSTAWGVRVGHYFSFLPWLGVEFQWYRRQPDADTQSVNVTGTLPVATGIFQFTGAGSAHVITDNMDTFGFMFNMRAPEDLVQRMGGNIEPYLGVGLAVNSIDVEEIRLTNAAGTLSLASAGDTDVDSSFLGQVGVNYRVTERLRAFVEYKYTGANFTFEQMMPTLAVETDYSDHTVAVGLKFTLFK